MAFLYVNGDSHTAGAEAVNQHTFAEDDPKYFYMGRAPHPHNLQVSWGKQLSDTLKMPFYCGAESASSNTRILRTTSEWLEKRPYINKDLLIIIQWSTWEREEWLIDGIYYQLTASGIDTVPADYEQKYKKYVVSINWKEVTELAHELIWKFHLSLKQQNIQHVFFNGNSDFSTIKNPKDWGVNYINPYDPSGTFNTKIRKAGFETVTPHSWHFGSDAHAYWKRVMLQYLISNKLF